MNKEELLKEFNEKVEQLRDEFISKLEDDKKEFEVELPEDGKELYFISRYEDDAFSFKFDRSEMDDIVCYMNGFCFETKEEAEQHLKEQRLLFKLHQWAKLKNDGWELDWEDDSQEKVFIYCFKNLKGNIELTYKRTWNINKFTKLPYFKTYEIAEECIELFGDEIKEVLANG